MKALRFHKAKDLRLEEVEAPDAEALAADELLIESAACGICGTDLSEYDHGPMMTLGEPHPLTGGAIPQILGHEVSGRVLAVGPEVDRYSVGDRISVMPMTFCGECESCRAGRPQLCRLLSTVGYHTRWGGFAERLVIREDQAAHLPDEVSDAAGSMVEPAAVAVTAVESGGVEKGDLVLVTGGGPIGQLVALAALAAGAGRVVLTRHRPLRGGLAELDGIELVDPVAEDVPALVAEQTDGNGADVAFECAGRAQGLDDALKGVKTGGVVLQVGASLTPLPLDTITLIMKDVTIRGSMCYPADSWPRIIAMIASGELPVERLITSTVTLEESIDRGFDRLMEADNDEVKIVVRTGSP